MSETDSKREELSQFLKRAEQGLGWYVLGVFRFAYAPIPLDIIIDLSLASSGRKHGFFRIYALGERDYAIRPMDPNIMMGGPPVKFSKDDPRLSDPGLQYIPGGDGEAYNPPRRYQLLELDQTWIIAERFEIEPLPQISTF